MIEKPKRPKQLNNQERKIPANIQELITRYDLDNKEIYDYLDGFVSQVNEFREGFLNLVYPIGSIYLSVNSVNPSTFLGGTWVQWGEGKTIIGVDDEDTDFDTAENTGGEKKHTLTIAEMPSHNHTFTNEGATKPALIDNGISDSSFGWHTSSTDGYRANAGYMDNAGGNQPHNNLQPYITCYMWKRTN